MRAAAAGTQVTAGDDVGTADVDDVATALAATTDRVAAARAVRRLERAACAPLGETGGETLVVLQRRGARALGRLARSDAPDVLGAGLADLGAAPPAPPAADPAVARPAPGVAARGAARAA